VISTIINITIAFLLSIYIIKNKNAFSLFICLFLYMTFHYSYAVIPIFSPFFNIDEYTVLHNQTQTGAKLVGFGYLFFVLSVIFGRYRRYFFSGIHYSTEKWLGSIFLLWGLMVFSHWTLKIVGGEYPSKVAFQDMFSSFLMVMFSWGFGTVLQTQKDIALTDIERSGKLLLVILITVVSIGTWEILSLRTHSGANIDSGEYLYRAHSLLFNPNVLGFWCAFLAIFTAFSFHSNIWSRKLSTLMIILTGYGILLSGSRSGLIICLFFLCMASVLLFGVPKRISKIATFRPLLTFIASLGTIGLLLKGFDTVTGRMLKGLHAMTLLVDRFVDMPKQISDYLFYRFSGNEIIKNIPASDPGFNIHARLNASVAVPDNGYLAMLEDGGWPVLIAWILLWILLVAIGVQTLRKAPGIRSSYSLSAVLGCGLSAMFMRSFQEFPFWVMISLALGLCLSWCGIILKEYEPLHKKKV
jgi:hypothetical protein